MRNALLIAAACTAITSQAAIWEFDLGPANGPFGLLGANERPTPTASPATGGEVKDHDSNNFINYDDSNDRLELHFAWGSDSSLDFGGQTGTDLTARLTGLHIHGSETSSVEGTAGILYDVLALALDPNRAAGEGFFNPYGGTLGDANTPNFGRTGAIDLTVQLVEGTGGFTIAQQEAQLLGNKWYINLHTEGQYSGGEIRGQLLTAIPEPEHYAAFAGLALLGFAGYRRFKTAPAA